MIYIVIAIVVIVLGAIYAGEIYRGFRLIVAHIKNDDENVTRFSLTYKECEMLAQSKYGYSPEAFAQIYKELLERYRYAYPYDALEFCREEWNDINRK